MNIPQGTQAAAGRLFEPHVHACQVVTWLGVRKSLVASKPFSPRWQGIACKFDFVLAAGRSRGNQLM